MTPSSIAFVVPFGEQGQSFFADSLLAHLCQTARDLGHRAELVHVYYDGRDPAVDARIAGQLGRWLDERACDLVVLDRVFDVTPLRGKTTVLVTRGDSFDPIEGIDIVVGATPGLTRSLGTRRTATVPELRLAFERLLRALAGGVDPAIVPGVGVVRDGALHSGSPLETADRIPFRAVAAHDVIAPGPAPLETHKTIFGNAGCPFAADPLANPHYRGVTLPHGDRVARLGCAFCAMGGDYEKRPDAEIVPALVEQALFWTRSASEVEALVLDDQSPLRYLASLLRAAHAAGVRPVRWLFAARPDGFVRDRARIEDAIAAARETGHRIEVYLSGFESFAEDELTRYNKGLVARDLVEAIRAMRQLATAHPDQFACADAKGHSLILWSPWTTPADLAESAATIRAESARDLFHELGKNRLRLYDDLPIRAAAERDGAVIERWEDGDRGEGRRKGYNVEQPWRFLDRRTRLAHELSRELRARLGAESEVAQLRAVASWAGRIDPATASVASVLEGLTKLSAALDALVGQRTAGPPRGRTTRARAVLFAGACNNGCLACSNRDRWLDDRREAIERRIDEARREAMPLLFAGREPSVHPAFLELVAHARGDDQRLVGVVTNGRLFSVLGFRRRAIAAGLTGASVKLFAARAEIANAIARVPGAHEQAVAGLRALVAMGVGDLELRAPLHATNLDHLADLADERVALRLECALDAVELDRLHDAAAAVDRLSRRCTREGIALDAGPLAASTRAFLWYPGARDRLG
jgi:pyruvate-formate lyase-activating enzyme